MRRGQEAEAEADEPIRVLVADRVFCMPSKILTNCALTPDARLVAALWFLQERRPEVEEIVERLHYDRTHALCALNELLTSSVMEGY